MKLLTLIFTFIASTSAFANITAICTETPKSVHESGGYTKGPVTIVYNTSKMTLTVDGETYTATIDPNFLNQKTARFINKYDSRRHKPDLTQAEGGETGIFLTKALGPTGKGTMSWSTNQTNDGDSGPALIWWTVATFACKKQ